MIFGKHINKYYLKYGPMLLLGLVALVAVDYLQLEIPKLYGAVINGMNTGTVIYDGVETVFDMAFLLDHICLPLLGIIAGIVMARLISSVMGTPTAISFPAILIAVVFSMVIGIVFGLLPAVKASNLNPIQALRRD